VDRARVRVRRSKHVLTDSDHTPRVGDAAGDLLLLHPASVVQDGSNMGLAPQNAGSLMPVAGHEGPQPPHHAGV
jgi:hypothetical protein